MKSPRKRNSALWHLYEEGTVTSAELAALTGWPRTIANGTLSRLMLKLLVRRADNERTIPATYCLTAEGKAAAAKVTRDQVDLAPAEADVAPGTDALAAGGELGRKTTSAPVFNQSPATLGFKDADDDEEAVFSISSRGELTVVDLDQEEPIFLRPAVALRLKRFLDNTSVLEELAAQEQL